MEMRQLDRRWQELEESPRPTATQLRLYLKMVRPHMRTHLDGAKHAVAYVSFAVGPTQSVGSVEWPSAAMWGAAHELPLQTRHA